MADDVIRSVRDFAARELRPAAQKVDRSGELPAEHWRKLAELGLAGLLIPPRWGGSGAELPTFLSALEAISTACASTGWMLLAHSAAAKAILVAGSDAQKDRYLPALAEGRLLGSALAATEAGGGSNPMAGRARAKREGNTYVLEGSKQFITLAGRADLYVVLAGGSEGPPAPSCFLVEKGDAGVAFGRREELMGMRGVPVGEITFEKCGLPADRLLGAAGGAMMILGAIGGPALLGASASALGIAESVLGDTTRYLKDRKVTDQPLASIPAVQLALGQLRMDVAGARAWLELAARSLAEPPRGPPVLVWMAKVAVTEAAVRVVDRCQQLHGAYGYSRALELERHARDVRAHRIHWGNNDVLIDSLAKIAAA